MFFDNALPKNFKLEIMGEPELSANIKTFNIPSIGSGLLNVPNNVTNNMNYPGDSIEYTDLIITFLVDEELNVVKKIWDWIKHNNSFTDSNGAKKVTDLKIFYTTNSGNVIDVLTLKDAFPSMTQDISIDYNDDNILNVDVTFNFSEISY